MSQATHDEPYEAHEGPIKTPKQVVITVVASFVIPVVLIIMLAHFVALGSRPGAGSEGLGEQAVAQRLEPVGKVEIRDASAPQVLRTGEQVFAAQCGVCHTSGAAGAPKVGDSAAWAPRIKTGFDALVQSAIKGKGAMPAQAGGDFNDLEIARAVAHLANQAGAKFEAPAAPAAASAPAAAASAPK